MNGKDDPSMMFDNVGILPCDLLLPSDDVAPETWACVACDQYTSQPECWEKAAEIVGDAPSCLKLVLPECYLSQTEQQLPLIHQAMAAYLADGTLIPKVQSGFILVERTTESGSRLGLVCAADLEEYDYTGRKCLIRPTEQTITARLPARLAIRREAPLELSHIMLLMDDPMASVIEPLYVKRGVLPKVYDFPLMQGGGHLTGWAITEKEDKAAILDALSALKATLGPNPLLFAVGDGNHSLATAKARWEELKPTLTPEQQLTYPARYAMVEIENIHDEALKFEPIHRLVKGVDPNALMHDWLSYCLARGMELNGQLTPDEQTLYTVYSGCEMFTAIAHPDGPLPVSTLQTYLDDFLARHPEAEIDYIHGDDVLRGLVSTGDSIGFLLPPIDKATFFDAVQTLGILPRKTFSMGHAHEKRFYMECRRIQ